MTAVVSCALMGAFAMWGLRGSWKMVKDARPYALPVLFAWSLFVLYAAIAMVGALSGITR